MNLFLNEESLHGQYRDGDVFCEALKQLNSLLNKVFDLNLTKACYLDSTLYLKPTIGEKLFAAALSIIREKSVRLQFSTLIDQLQMSPWTSARLHGDGPYKCHGLDKTNTSIAEAAERNLRSQISALIAFCDSSYSLDPLSVEIPNGCIITISTIVDPNGLALFFQRHLEFGVVSYDSSHHQPPHDSQTVLVRKARFRRTSKINHGQTVYLEISTGRYWCVDAKHFGQSAHLEVFDSSRKHISKAKLDGTLIPNSGKGWYF